MARHRRGQEAGAVEGFVAADRTADHAGAGAKRTDPQLWRATSPVEIDKSDNGFRRVSARPRSRLSRHFGQVLQGFLSRVAQQRAGRALQRARRWPLRHVGGGPDHARRHRRTAGSDAGVAGRRHAMSSATAIIMSMAWPARRRPSRTTFSATMAIYTSAPATAAPASIYRTARCRYARLRGRKVSPPRWCRTGARCAATAQSGVKMRTDGLSINLATVRQQWNLLEAVEACARHGITAVDPWRDQVANDRARCIACAHQG